MRILLSFSKSLCSKRKIIKSLECSLKPKSKFIFLLGRNNLQRSVTANGEHEVKVLEAIQKYGKPVSVGYIAWKLKISWSTAQSILLKMSLGGQVVAIDTSRGFVFSLEKKRLIKNS